MSRNDKRIDQLKPSINALKSTDLFAMYSDNRTEQQPLSNVIDYLQSTINTSYFTGGTINGSTVFTDVISACTSTVYINTLSPCGGAGSTMTFDGSIDISGNILSGGTDLVGIFSSLSSNSPWTAGTGTNSAVLIGSNSIATGTTSVAMGSYTVAAGDYSLAGGKGTGNPTDLITASGLGSFAFLTQVNRSGSIGANADYSTVLGGTDHNIASGSDYSTIIGGNLNTITGSSIDSTIIGGYGNVLSAGTRSSIVGGSGNTMYSSYSSIVGGVNNLIQKNSHYGFIGGGMDNTINNAPPPNENLYATILNGTSNYIDHRANYGTILGGSNNVISGDTNTSQYVTIMNGDSNTISSSIVDNNDFASTTILNGSGNNVTSNVLGKDCNLNLIFGDGNDITNYQQCIVLGNNNTLSTSVGGSSNDAIIIAKNSSIIGTTSNCSIVGSNESYITESGLGAIFGGDFHNITGSSRSVILGGTYNTLNQPSTDSSSAIIGGVYNTINGSGKQSIIVGGSGNTLNGNQSIILGGIGITGSADDTVYVPHLEIQGQANTPVYNSGTGTTFTLDFDNSNIQTVTLTGNTTMNNPLNVKDGAVYTVIMKQGSTTGTINSWGSNFKFEGGTTPTLTTNANAVDIMTFISDDVGNLYGLTAFDFQ